VWSSCAVPAEQTQGTTISDSLLAPSAPSLATRLPLQLLGWQLPCRATAVGIGLHAEIKLSDGAVRRLCALLRGGIASVVNIYGRPGEPFGADAALTWLGPS
jgi:hypothetical protein